MGVLECASVGMACVEKLAQGKSVRVRTVNLPSYFCLDSTWKSTAQGVLVVVGAAAQ